MARYPISFSTLGCPKWPWRKVLDEAARLGYAGIELRGLEGEMDLTKRPEFGATRIAATVKDLRSLDLVITDLGASTRLHEPDPRALATQMDEARRFIDLGHRLGAPWVRVFPDRFVPGEPREVTIARAGARRTRIQAFREDAGPSSIRLALDGVALPWQPLRSGWQTYEWELPADLALLGPVDAAVIVDALPAPSGNAVHRAIAIAEISLLAR